MHDIHVQSQCGLGGDGGTQSLAQTSPTIGRQTSHLGRNAKFGPMLLFLLLEDAAIDGSKCSSVQF